LCGGGHVDAAVEIVTLKPAVEANALLAAVDASLNVEPTTQCQVTRPGRTPALVSSTATKSPKHIATLLAERARFGLAAPPVPLVGCRPQPEKNPACPPTSAEAWDEG
jgi:hypothetical protein